MVDNMWNPYLPTREHVSNCNWLEGGNIHVVYLGLSGIWDSQPQFVFKGDEVAPFKTYNGTGILMELVYWDQSLLFSLCYQVRLISNLSLYLQKGSTN